MSRRSDAIGLWNKDAGATLAKMSAEAILCQNLLVALLGVVLAHREGIYVMSALDRISDWAVNLLVVLLIISVIHRNVAFLFRQKSYYDQSKSPVKHVVKAA